MGFPKLGRPSADPSDREWWVDHQDGARSFRRWLVARRRLEVVMKTFESRGPVTSASHRGSAGFGDSKLSYASSARSAPPPYTHAAMGRGNCSSGLGIARCGGIEPSIANLFQTPPRRVCRTGRPPWPTAAAGKSPRGSRGAPAAAVGRAHLKQRTSPSSSNRSGCSHVQRRRARGAFSIFLR